MGNEFNYEQKWNELNNTSKSSNKGISACVDENSFFKVYLFSDFQKMKRSVIIKLPNQYKIKKKIPDVLGVRCDIDINYGGLNGNLFAIEQKYAVHTTISELFMSEISRIIIELEDIELFEDVLHKIFEDWKSYFVEEMDLFGPQKQLGLYGEMYFMYNVLFKELGITPSINAWKGYEKNRHDFEIPNISFEIKATTSNNPIKVKISNEKQLEKGKLKYLYLTVYNMVSSESSVGDLPKLVNLISKELDKDPHSRNMFRRNIMSLGYIFEKEGEYNRSYAIINKGEEYYEVDDTFPSIRLKQLGKLNKSNALMDIKYSINIDACQKYQCKNPYFK